MPETIEGRSTSTIRQGKSTTSSGSLTGYHWGLTRKRAIIGWEAARLIAAEAA